jgi:hypothetical protein
MFSQEEFEIVDNDSISQKMIKEYYKDMKSESELNTKKFKNIHYIINALKEEKEQIVRDVRQDINELKEDQDNIANHFIEELRCMNNSIEKNDKYIKGQICTIINKLLETKTVNENCNKQVNIINNKHKAFKDKNESRIIIFEDQFIKLEDRLLKLENKLKESNSKTDFIKIDRKFAKSKFCKDFIQVLIAVTIYLYLYSFGNVLMRMFLYYSR